MSGRLNYYYRQKVTEAELDSGFATLEVADRALAVDHALWGVTNGLVVSQHSSPQNLTVDITAGAAYDKIGQRVGVGSTQTLNCAVDESAVSTTVASPGNSKILSVFAKFTRALTDPRIDGNSITVYFSEAESFQLIVRQGAEAASPSPPALDGTHILLCDITITFGQTQIVNANISTTRREDLIVASGSPRSLRNGTIKAAFASLLGYYDNHVTAAADRHAASAIDGTATGNWADATNVGAGTVQAMLSEIVSDLAATTGDVKVGAPLRSGTPVSLSAGSVGSQLAALLAAVNAQAVYAHYQFDSGTVNSNGTIAPVTVVTENGGFTEGATDEIQVPSAGTYSVVAELTAVSTGGATSFFFQAEIGGAAVADTRSDGLAGEQANGGMAFVMVITTPSSQRLRFKNSAAAGHNFQFGSRTGRIVIRRIL